MKLVDILARELRKWPEGAAFLTQSMFDPEIYQTKGGINPSDLTSLRPPVYVSQKCQGLTYELVTCAEWQAAVDALKAKEVIGWWHPAPGNPHKAFAAISSRKSHSDLLGDGFEGEKEDGSKYHVLTEHWTWRPVDALPAKWNGEGLPPVGANVEVVGLGEGYKPDSLKSWADGDKVECIAHVIMQGNSHLFPVFFNKRTIEFSSLRADVYRPIRTPEQIAAEEREVAICAMMEVCSELPCRQSCADLYDAGCRKQEPK